MNSSTSLIEVKCMNKIAIRENILVKIIDDPRILLNNNGEVLFLFCANL